MKKSFLVLICVVFVAAVIAVGIYGLKYDSYYEVIYPTSINCDKYRIGDGELVSFTVPETSSMGCDYYTRISPEGAAMQVISLMPTVFPTNATETSCTLTLGGERPGVTVDSETKTITIDYAACPAKNFSFKVTVVSNHDTSLQQTILFYVIR